MAPNQALRKFKVGVVYEAGGAYDTARSLVPTERMHVRQGLCLTFRAFAQLHYYIWGEVGRAERILGE